MIVDALINIFSLPVVFFFDIIPDLPMFPTAIPGYFAYLISIVNSFSQIAVYIYGQALFIAIVTLSIALLLFDQGYNLIMFVAKKMPFINLK